MDARRRPRAVKRAVKREGNRASRDCPMMFTVCRSEFDGLRQRLKRWRGELPAFGRAVEIIINYSPDRAIRFDLEGNAVELFDRAYRLGIAQFAIGGRVVSPGELFSVTETTR